VNEAVDIDVADDEARGAAAGVLVNPLQILGYADTRSADPVENRDKVLRSELVIPCDQAPKGAKFGKNK